MPAKKTDLLDRYLHALKFWLPKAQQQDIIAEIAEDLHSQIQEREDALGRPLDEAEMAGILKRRGAPVRVASGYVTEPRLINPAMFPIYRLVLKIVLLWVLAPLFILVYLGPVFSSPNPGAVLGLFLIEAFRAGFTTVGIVTTVFFLLDRYHAKIMSIDDWDPRKLPRVPPASETMAAWNSFASATVTFGGAIFWAFWMWRRTAFGFPGGIRIVLAPIWGELYWPIVVLTLADGFLHLFSFFYPAAMQVRARLQIGLDLISIVVVALLFRVDHWIELTGVNLTAAEYVKVMLWINITVLATLISILLIKVIDAIWQIRRLIRRKPLGEATMLTES